MAAFLAVLTPEADPVVRHLRERWDPSARRGLGAHITVRYPFLPPEQLSPRDLDQLASAVGSVRAFRFTLARISRFPSTIFLDPEPVAPFATLRAAIERTFGPRLPVDSFPQYVPHLSVARNVRRDAGEVLAALDAAMAGEPVVARCDALVLLARDGGPWRARLSFPLAT